MNTTLKTAFIPLFAFFLAAGSAHTSSAAEPDEAAFAAMRERMVTYQIARRGVEDREVLRAMNTVPRHRFVPKRLLEEAYDDTPLPIGYGQTISQPYIVAYMTEIVEADRESAVLEIGTGSGYQAAVLAAVAGSVYTIEIIPELAESATRQLEKLGYGNVTVRCADGYYGWEEHAPFDAIIVTAAAGHIPPPLVRQLKPGGRMVIPVGGPFMVQNLVLVEKDSAGKITTRNLMAVRFVPLTGRRE
ncbi:MAG: protein-L-isoaspartate(D-aspartate) O-methyltransferase [Deltaproteobacteria bacterium]|nr:protein-L-isoaspartate(D-aspartate) O-methyltransferase [Deltaproteobacteria bacterium]